MTSSPLSRSQVVTLWRCQLAASSNVTLGSCAIPSTTCSRELSAVYLMCTHHTVRRDSASVPERADRHACMDRWRKRVQSRLPRQHAMVAAPSSYRSAWKQSTLRVHCKHASTRLVRILGTPSPSDDGRPAAIHVRVAVICSTRVVVEPALGVHQIQSAQSRRDPPNVPRL